MGPIPPFKCKHFFLRRLGGHGESTTRGAWMGVLGDGMKEMGWREMRDGMKGDGMDPYLHHTIQKKPYAIFEEWYDKSWSISLTQQKHDMIFQGVILAGLGCCILGWQVGGYRFHQTGHRACRLVKNSIWELWFLRGFAWKNPGGSGGFGGLVVWFGAFGQERSADEGVCSFRWKYWK